MHIKLLQGRGTDDGRVLLACPSNLDEYRAAFEVLGRADRPDGDGGPPPAPPGDRPAPVSYVVTTAGQRRAWRLPDFAASGRAPLLDEAEALRLLHDRALRPETAYGPFAGDDAGPAPPSADGRSFEEALEALKALVPDRDYLDGAVDGLRSAGLPDAALDRLPDAVRAGFESQRDAVGLLLDRVQVVCGLPWWSSDPQVFDREHVRRALDRTHAGLDDAKARILDILAACPQARDPLTVEAFRSDLPADADPRSVLIVRPAPPREPAPVLCLAGAPGTGRATLALSIAAALGRTPVREQLGGRCIRSLLHGARPIAPGSLVIHLLEERVKNPVLILEELDKVGGDDADVLVDLLDASRRAGFRDDFTAVPFDLSGVLVIATAVDPEAVPPKLRRYLEVVELPGYTEDEKVVIAQRHLLERPFDASVRLRQEFLAPEPPARPPAAGGAPPRPPCPFVLVADRLASSLAELASVAAEPPGEGGPVEAWRTAASGGSVIFDDDALRLVIRDHTSEAGVSGLARNLAVICREVLRRRPAGARGSDIVTPAVAAEILGGGGGRPADSVPPAPARGTGRGSRGAEGGSAES